MKFVPKEVDGDVNIPKVNQGMEFLWLAAAAAVIVVLIYMLLGLAVDVIAPRVPPQLELKLGKGYAAFFDDGKRDEAEKELEKILAKLTAAAPELPYDFKVHIAGTPDVNAIALPGGGIIVFAGLINKVKSENELAFILAHELGHFAHRDHLRGMGKALIINLLAAVVTGGDSGAEKMAGVIIPVTAMKFSRDQEKKADLYALELLNAAYGHAGGASHLFEKMKKMEIMPDYVYYFASHPGFDDRIETLRKAAAEKGFSEGTVRPLAKALKNVNEEGRSREKNKYGF